MKNDDQSSAALNWLNFFAADVATGVGPFLVVFLSVNLQWTPSDIGLAISAMSFATVIFQSPAGLLVDKTKRKRNTIIIPSVLMAVSGLAMLLAPSFTTIISAQIIMGIGGAFFGPGLIALAQMLTHALDFDKIISKNQAYNHAGNVITAILIGVICKYADNKGVFYCLFILAIFCIISTLKIRTPIPNTPTTISDKGEEGKTIADSSFFKSKAFLVFLLSAFVFHFANASMLPLVGQEISKDEPDNASVYMSACIVIAQLVMIPVAFWCGQHVHNGRKRLMAIAFAALVVRALLCLLSKDTFYLMAIQILDGIAGGIFGIVSVLIVADLAGESGKSSLAQGVLATAVGLGASLSNLLSGFITEHFGFRVCFILLGLLAMAALALFLTAMPETLTKNISSNKSI